jgi:hypothetical protein
MSITRHLEVIFCDDIREELGNKLSFMGVYSADMTVPVVPIILNKLCIVVRAITENYDRFESLKVSVFQGDDNVELISTGQIVLPDANLDSNKSPLQVIQLTFMLSPFQIDKETTIRVQAITEREELNSVGLIVHVPQAGTH